MAKNGKTERGDIFEEENTQAANPEPSQEETKPTTKQQKVLVVRGPLAHKGVDMKIGSFGVEKAAMFLICSKNRAR
jgi:hypothetical protein